MDPNAITYFGETDARNKKIRFGIKAKDRLKHVYVIGKTGMGKSTLLENMAIQDIQNGEGMTFIDPHGGTAEKLLEYVPEHRIKDVLYFAPFDMEYPVSFNVLEDVGEDKRHLVVNGLMSTFEKIWVDAWSARIAYILTNTLLALLEYPGATLLGVNRMLTDKEYRKKVVDNVKDPSVKIFWVEEFGKWTEKFVSEAIPAIQNKVGQFTANPLVRNLLGQAKSSFDIRSFMDERKIIIINMSKGLVGEGNARLIGSMLITKIYLAAMSRADRDEQSLAKLPNFYLYVDEFQSFANKSFADILSEARKYKLNLTIAHQYIEQMEEEVRDAVFGNVGTMITFRVGAFDAEVLEKEFAPTFTAEDLVNLGFTQIYLKLMIDGVSSQPFSSTTMAPIARSEKTFKAEVIASSRELFARPRAQVEKEVQDWHSNGGSVVKNPQNEQPREQQRESTSVQSGQRMQYIDTRNTGARNVPSQNVQSSQSFQTAKYLQTSPREFPLKKPENRERYSAPETPLIPTHVSSREIPAPTTPQQTQSQGQVEDNREQNRFAFAQAAELLLQKQELVLKTMDKDEEGNIQKQQQSERHNPQPKVISLSSLIADESKKNPSAQNISNLKSALAEALKKTQPSQSLQPQPVRLVQAMSQQYQPKQEEKRLEIPVEKQAEKLEEKVFEKIPEKVEKVAFQIKSQQQNEKLFEKPMETLVEKPVEKIAEPIASAHEIPEKVLRELLSMDSLVDK